MICLCGICSHVVVLALILYLMWRGGCSDCDACTVVCVGYGVPCQPSSGSAWSKKGKSAIFLEAGQHNLHNGFQDRCDSSTACRLCLWSLRGGGMGGLL